MVQLSEQDAGRTIDATLGSTVVVRLKENPTTGYRWTAESQGGVSLVGSHFEGGTAVGAGGERVLEFRASHAGTHTLRLKHWREWEGEASVIGRFEATINVR